jgi:hypothetical protein
VRLALRQVGTCHGLLLVRKRDLLSWTQTLAFDPSLQRLYTAAETGLVAVFSVAADHSVAESAANF